ncbi:TolC family outer membrane protein [Rhizobium sp. S152]|uniref:TolC family outer membrane protein n=1 Tax=Rhizobium sp. S152 TaxID=3055038 RepID=UPI0025A98F85|nr:TolC family outer membrane protein [Rhizobium sp. S152]MDM9626775.1 TolC family outer membrane protein [Rhizobium sp. S152]
MTLQQAIEKTMKTNPQILQAAKDREAVEFELRQARGLYLPSVDLEAGIGRRRLSNNSSGALRSDHDYLSPGDVGLTVSQTIFDGGSRKAQVQQQAARVDGASFRVLERSEALALEVTQDYLEYMLQNQIVAAAKQNVSFHQGMVGDISESIKGGALTDADRLQGSERLQAAKARLREALEELEQTKIRFLQAVGEQISNPSTPPSVAKYLPKTLNDAVYVAARNSPRIYSANADVDAADAGVRGARANYMPKVNLEGTARVGDDIDGDEGNTNDYQVRVVARWNLYRGGIDVAREQEQIRRSGEQRYALAQVQREVEQSVRSAWNERVSRSDLSKILGEQTSINERLVGSYREQFKVGQRSLLDVLDAQNTRFNTKVLADTARVASLFAEYKILAASGNLLQTMKLRPVEQAQPYARDGFAVPATSANPNYVELDSHQKAGMPLDLLAPIRQQ